MNDVITLAQSQLDDPRYLKSVTSLGNTCPIVANRDIHSASGIKLINAGMRINSSLYERLLEHKFSPNLDQCLSAENVVTGQSLAEMSARMLKEDKRLTLIESTQMDGWKLPFVMKQVILPPAIAFKLTVMRETQAELFRHSLYVAIVSAYIGIQLRLEKHQLLKLATAALLHDIGILHVDSTLLERNHKMSEMERRHLYVHPLTAWLILNAYPEYPAEVLDAVLQHHERLDGSGYPRSLRDGEIGQLGQIVAVAEIIASRYSHEGAEFGWSRLETILKLNLRRYGWNLVRHLKVFYQEEGDAPPCSDSDKQASREKMSRISSIFLAWEAARAQCDKGDPVCDAINERMVSLKTEIIDAGLNPYAEDSSFLDLHEGSRACFDAKILLDETLWQLYGILQEMRRRWPSIDAKSSSCACSAVCAWMNQVEESS